MIVIHPSHEPATLDKILKSMVDIPKEKKRAQSKPYATISELKEKLPEFTHDELSQYLKFLCSTYPTIFTTDNYGEYFMLTLEAEPFLSIGGFTKLAEQESLKAAQEAEAQKLDIQEKKASIRASDAAIESARYSRGATTAAWISAVVSGIALIATIITTALQSSDNQKTEDRLRAIENSLHIKR